MFVGCLEDAFLELESPIPTPDTHPLSDSTVGTANCGSLQALGTGNVFF